MKIIKSVLLLLLTVLLLTGCAELSYNSIEPEDNNQLEVVYSSTIPDYTGEDVIEINNNQASFTPEEITSNSFESYSPLDSLGRVQTALACLGLDTLPTQDRGDISDIKPTGWIQNQYDFIEGESLYNRSHLIAYSLSAENDNELNLITGTEHFNQDLMTIYEKQVRNYIDHTGNHVMYRVTPKFTGNNLLADGVQMEAYSVEDEGQGINFNIFCYNVQPGVKINYVDGSNQLDPNREGTSEDSSYNQAQEYIINTKSKKIHLPDCSGVTKMNDKNKEVVNKSLEELYAEGYTACGNCIPDRN